MITNKGYVKKIFVVIAVIIVFLSSGYATGDYKCEEKMASRLYACQQIIEFVQKHKTVELVNSPSQIIDTNDAAVVCAEKLGMIPFVVDGKFLPESIITNKEFVIMLKHALDYVLPDIIYDNAKATKYKDLTLLNLQEKFDISMFSSLGVLIKSVNFYPDMQVVTHDVGAVISRIINRMESLPKSDGEVSIKRKMPILMYHCISTPKQTDLKYLYVTESDFEAQIKWLSENGYTFLFADEMSYADKCSKPVVVTFDDGYRDNYQAYKIMLKYNAKGNIYVVTDNIDKPNNLSKEQIEHMDKSGVIRFGSHTKTHTNLKKLSLQEVAYEMEESNRILGGITGRAIDSFSYPYGGVNYEIANISKGYYKVALAVYDGNYKNKYALNRIMIYNSMPMNQFKIQVRKKML